MHVPHTVWRRLEHLQTRGAPGGSGNQPPWEVPGGVRGASRPVDLGQWRGKRGGSAVRAARLGFYRGVRLQGELVTEPRRPSVCGVTDWVTGS